MSKLELYYPVKPAHVNQAFGDMSNLAWYQAHGLNFKGHNGIDFQASHGQPIYAAHSGNAYWESDGSSGEGVVICSTDTFDYNGTQAKMKTIYWHMCDPVKEPKFASPVYGAGVVSVKAGDLIGYADNTGLSTGDHLHFGLKPGLPNEPDALFINLENTNGYYGAIDPAPYFNGKYAQDINSTSVPVETPLEARRRLCYPAIAGLNSKLRFGDKGTDVKRLQMLLIDCQYSIPAGPTGNYLYQTLAAVKAWKKDNKVQ